MSTTTTLMKERGRARAMRALSRGGERVARLDSHAGTHRAILRALPMALVRRFDASAAGSLQATFELQVRDPHGGRPASFGLVIADGNCRIVPGQPADAGATATIGADDMIRLASGAVAWPQLLAAGRLELSGDPFLALRFPMLFRLPADAS